MNKIFDKLINSFIDDKVGISENFLSTALSTSLKENLNLLFLENKLRLAGIGNDLLINQDKKIRGDKVYWLDRKHENVSENNFLDLIDRVFIRPSRKEIEVFYAAIDLFIMASKAENFGMVTIEAMASGVPVIASNGGGSPEILGEGKFGRLCEPLNAQSLCEQLKEFI